jgi:hypothetical protein
MLTANATWAYMVYVSVTFSLLSPSGKVLQSLIEENTIGINKYNTETKEDRDDIQDTIH